MAVEAPAAPPVTPAAPAPAQTPPTPTNFTEPSRTPLEAPKPGSTRERMQKATEKYFKPQEGDDSPEPAKTPEPGKQPETPPKRPGEETTPAVEPPPDVTPEQKKKNPWVLLRESEKRAKALEQQMSEAKAASMAEQEKAKYEERITKAEAKLKEKEDEIRFKSYEKSDEFKTKYEQPYEAAWERQWADLREVTINGDDGVARPVVHQDILDLMNLSLPDANKLAREKWGDFANEAMAARKELRTLFNAKITALEEARKTGADREKQFEENRKKWQDGVQKHIKDTWDSANQAAASDARNGEYFKPVEGDDTRNQLLGKGFALVDEAFGKNPMDPKLTPEERAAVVRKHAAVRNRAAAFGPMKYIIARLRAEVEALKKANGEFKGSQPPAGGGTSAAGSAPTSGAKGKMREAGDKWAR